MEWQESYSEGATLRPYQQRGKSRRGCQRVLFLPRQSTVITKAKEIPIYYRVIEKDGEWRVYDVVIEGISLVNNYRTQFREILTNKPPEVLLETLRKKVSKA
jgi:hypothetical protein